MRPDSDRGQKRYELAFLSLASHATPPQQGETFFPPVIVSELSLDTLVFVYMVP